VTGMSSATFAPSDGASRPTVTVGLAMRALVVTGHGEAVGDAEGLFPEATEVVSAIEVCAAHSGQVAAVLSLLIGTGSHDPHDVVEAAHLRRDAERIVAAVTTGRVGGVR
jgi:hypothetical protein